MNNVINETLEMHNAPRILMKDFQTGTDTFENLKISSKGLQQPNFSSNISTYSKKEDN